MDNERPYADRRLITAGVICLVGVAVTHLLDLSHKVEEAPYVAVLFGLVIVTSIALAVLLVRGYRLELVWAVAGLLSLAAILGYIYSRTIGLPQLDDHVGHWRDSVGTASLVFEASLIGLSLPALRVRTLRFAPAASLLAVGLVLGAVITGQAAAGHEHGGGGHDHAGMNVYTATPKEQREGEDHLRRAIATSRRLPTIEAARAAGYDFLPRTYAQQKNLDFWHLTNMRYQRDDDYVDPERPETLMFWNDKKGDTPPTLIGYVYRMPRRVENPEMGGPLFTWHAHRRGGDGKWNTGPISNWKMTHLWLTDDLKSAFSSEMPLQKLNEKFGTPEEGGVGAGA